MDTHFVLASSIAIGLYVFGWVLRIIALFIVPRNRKPTAGMAWLLVIFLSPSLGWLAFLLLGTPKLSRRRRNMQRTLDTQISTTIKTARAEQTGIMEQIESSAPAKYQPVVSLAERLTHLPLFTGNTVEPLPEYTASIDRLVRDIRQAQHYIHIEYYIFVLDTATEPLFAAIEAALRRDVVVRVLYDAYGSRKFARRKEMIERLRTAGASVQPMLPLRFPGKHYTRPDLRNHRKLVVIDGLVGYTGSLNMVQRDYHRRDTIVYNEIVVRITGPTVLQLGAVFLTDWYAETGSLVNDAPPNQAALKAVDTSGSSPAHIVPSGPGYDYNNNQRVFTTAFYQARDRITIVNPYFVPDESLLSALVSASQRGVRVTILNSEAIDQAMVAHAQRSYYESLLAAGIQIRLYRAPTLLHSKYLLIDDDCAMIGSSNMDIRSFELNQELTLAVYDPSFVAKLQAITDVSLKKSRRVHASSWAQRKLRSKLLDNLARLTSSLQ